MDTWSTFLKVELRGTWGAPDGLRRYAWRSWAEQHMLSERNTIDEDRVQVAHYALFSARVPNICESIFVDWKPEMEFQRETTAWPPSA
jgi:hypothetical protein